MCDIEFSGPDCSISGCPLNCSLNGVCMGGNCSCFYGWEVMRVNQLFVLQIVLTEVAATMVPAFVIQDILDQIAPT